jgi:two-component system, response regulator
VVTYSNRLLLVEDDPNDVELIRLAFDAYDFLNQMDVASDGEQALQYLFGADLASSYSPLPRLVLLDLKLPKISGIQVLEAIRRHPRTRNLVVVVMTSSAEDRDIEICYNLGVNSYVVKPLDYEQFLEASRDIGVYWMKRNQPAQQVA